MMTLNPAQRPTIEDIMNHPWMQGAVPSANEIKADFTQRKAAVDAEAHNEREAKRQKRAEADGKRVVRRSGTNDCEDGEMVENLRDAWKDLDVEEYGPYFVQDYTQFFMTSQPLDYFEDLVNYFDSVTKTAYRISGSTLRLSFNTVLGGPAEESKENAAAASDVQGKEVRVSVQILKVSDNKHCVKFTYKDPKTKSDLDGNTSPEIIKHFLSIRDSEELKIFVDTTFDEAQ